MSINSLPDRAVTAIDSEGSHYFQYSDWWLTNMVTILKLLHFVLLNLENVDTSVIRICNQS